MSKRHFLIFFEGLFKKGETKRMLLENGDESRAPSIGHCEEEVAMHVLRASLHLTTYVSDHLVTGDVL